MKLKFKLDVTETTAMHLAKYDDPSQAVSDILNEYYEGDVGSPRRGWLSKKTILHRAFYNNASKNEYKFTKSDFFNHFLSDDKFNELYEMYSNYGGADKSLLPSFKMHNKLKKVTVMRYDKVMERRNARAVEATYIDGTVEVFSSITKAVEALGKSRTTMTTALRSDNMIIIPDHDGESDTQIVEVRYV